MARVKRGVTSRAKHKKVLKAVKGQWGRRKNTIRVAKQAMEKAMQYAYRDRRNKKRDFKSLWIQRINAGVRTEGLTYSRFINRGNVIDNGIFSRYNRDFRASTNIRELSSAYVSAMKKFPYPQVHFHNQIRFLSNDKRRSIEINKKIIDLGKNGNYEMLRKVIINNIGDFNDINVSTAFNI